MDPVEISLKEPLDEQTKELLIKDFDGRNIYPREGHGWWSTATEKDKPSYKDNKKVDPDGTIHLEGIDHTEGRWRTRLDIAGDNKTIKVDRNWNAGSIEQILKEKHIKYELTDFYSKMERK